MGYFKMKNKNIMRKVLAKLKLYGVDSIHLKFIKDYLKENDINIDSDKIINADGTIICGNDNLLCIIECNPLKEMNSNINNVNIIILNGSNIIKLSTDFCQRNLKLHHITPKKTKVFSFYNDIGFINEYPKEVSDQLYMYFSKDFNLLDIDDIYKEKESITIPFMIENGYQSAKNIYEIERNDNKKDIIYLDEDGNVYKL